MLMMEISRPMSGRVDIQKMHSTCYHRGLVFFMFFFIFLFLLGTQEGRY